MLSRADADLVRRDAAVPGLATVLDPEAFAEKFVEQVGEPIESAEVTYVRYKPRQSCLVGYRIESGGQSSDVCATAYRSDVSSKAAKALCRPGRVPLAGLNIIVHQFPDDDKLRALPWLASPEARRRLLEKVLPKQPELWSSALEPIRYKPERRYVARLIVAGEPRAVIKAYSPSGYEAAAIHAKSFRPDSRFHLPDRMGRSNRHCLLAFDWLPGLLLTQFLGDATFDSGVLRRVGAALAGLHEQRSKKLHPRTRNDEAASFLPLASWLAAICPNLDARAHALAATLADRISQLPAADHSVHGDFYAKQIVVDNGTVGIIDFDEAFRGDPAHDLGLFLAHLERDALRGMIPCERVGAVRGSLLDGYGKASRHGIEDARIRLYAAAGLLRIAAHPFRRREPDWPKRTAELLDKAEHELQAAGHPVMMPVNASGDSAMQFLADALDPARAGAALRRNEILNENATVSGARMVRHKVGRRCLIEYELAADDKNAVAVLGKARAKGLDRASFDLVCALRRCGFDEHSADGVAAPEPLGVVSEYHMWVQRKVDGVTAREALASADGPALASRLAEALHKLHRANLPTMRRHTATEEVAMLETLYDELARAMPQWSRRLSRLLEACRLSLASLPAPTFVGIHRDFYPDQVIVAGDLLYLLDLDLYAVGDPALDAGNFLGHLTEYSLRTFGDGKAWADREQAFEERFIELTGANCRQAVRAYASATLARHVALSQRFPDRRHCTESLLEMCERRFALGSKGRGAAPARSNHRLKIGEPT